MEKEYISQESWSKIFLFLKSIKNIYVMNENKCKNFIESVFWMVKTGAQWRNLDTQSKSNQYTCIARGTPAEKMLEHFKKDDVVWSEQEWSDFKNEVDMLDKAIAKLIAKNAKPESEDVQALIQKHYELQSNFFNLTHDAYLALIQMYEDDDATIKIFFEAYHPKMQKFICEAMRHYATKIL